MGVCVSKKSNKTVPESAYVNKTLHENYKDFKEKLHFLHKLTQDYEKNLETCIINEDKELGFLFKSKIEYFKTQTAAIQSFLKDHGNAIESRNQKQKTKIVNDAKNLMQTLTDDEILEDDIEKILEKNSEYNDLALVKLKRKNLDFQEIEYYIVREVNKKLYDPTKKNRRKYTRNLGLKIDN